MQCRLTTLYQRQPSRLYISHVLGYIQSLALCLNLLHLQHAIGVRCSLNSNIIIAPLLNNILSNMSSFSTSSFVATLTITNTCWLRGLSYLSHLIIYTSTLFSILKRSIANLLTFPLLISITRGTLTQSALTIYHLGPTSLVLGMCGLSYQAVICLNIASLSFSTKNLIMLALLLIRYMWKSLSIAPISLLTSFMPYAIVCFTTLVVATFSIAFKPTQLISITSC